MKSILLTLLCAMSMTLAAQTAHQPLRNSGQLPADFTTPSSVKYKKDISRIKQNESNRDKKDKDNFYLESNFAIDGLLRSGKILLEPEYSAYMGKIADILLKDQPELRPKVRFYLMRSPSVNAFATNDGVIFVSLGLLAQLENEAQLAFILSHEITHVEKRHALNFFLKGKKLEREKSQAVSRQEAREERISDRELAKHQFSREQENEADDLGLGRYLNTSYSLATTDRVFDVLRYSYLPFDDVVFERNFFENDYIRLPNSYFAKKIRPIEGANENEDDSKMTHPNLGKRRTAVKEKLQGKTDEGRSKYLVSEATFKKLQALARYELPQLYNHIGEYQDALYACFLLQKAEGSSQYLDKQISKALYGYAKFRNHTDILAYAEQYKPDSIEGESQQVYYLFNKLTKKELNILAVSHIWRMSKKYNEDIELKRMGEDILWELVQKHNLQPSSFKKEKAPLQTASVDSTKTAVTETPTQAPPKEQEKPKSKYDKIKAKEDKEEKTESNQNDWWRYAFGDLLADETFTTTFQKMADNNKNRKAQREEEEDEDGISNERQRQVERATRLPMGVGKVVIVSPFYTRIDTRSIEGVKRMHLETEEGDKRFCRLLRENAKLVDLQTTMLVKSELKAGDTEKFNDIMVLNEWFNEQGDAGRHSFVPTNQAEVEAIAKKYGTDYFVWTGVVSGRQNEIPYYLNILYRVYLPWSLPNAIRSIIDKQYSTLFFAIIYNVKTGKNEVLHFGYLDKKDSDMTLNAHLYDMLLQIRASKNGQKVTPNKTKENKATAKKSNNKKSKK